jgi:Uma2 family endonuclease
MTLPLPIKRYTVQEYYQLERTADYKSDFYRGEIFAMAGGTSRHSLICTNISGEMRARLKQSPCTAYESNLRLKVKATGLRNYPDVSVYCQPLEYDEEDRGIETATNPTVLVEVLSKTTEAYDRGFKSENYRQIDTLKAYLLVSQEKPHVEIFLRQSDGSWAFREESGLEAVLEIPPLGIELPFAEIYARVDFSAPESAPISAKKE